MSSSYLKILRSNNFFLLFFSQIISQFGDKLTQMALIGLVYKLEGSSSLTLAKILSLTILPVFFISPIAGVYIDRWDKRKTMYISDFLRGFLMLLIPIVFFKFKSLFIIYILVFFSFSLGRFFIPAKMSIIPLLVSSQELGGANSLISSAATIAAILGFGLGGLIVQGLGVGVAFTIDALTFFISAFAILFIKVKSEGSFKAKDIFDLSKEAIIKVKNSFIFEIREGLNYLLKTKETRYASRIFFILFSCVGSLYTVFIVFIQETFMSITLDLGIFAVGAVLGLLLGSLIYGKFGLKFSLDRTINFSLFFSSLYLIFFVSLLKFYPIKVFALTSCFILGILESPVVIAVNTLVHKESNNQFWGRTFSSLEVIIHLAFIVFMFLSSYLAEKFNSFTIIIFVGIIISIFSSFELIKERL
ncbi:MAG: MFS transporter [Candidatus Aenigmatarchaeota archaeon]